MRQEPESTRVDKVNRQSTKSPQADDKHFLPSPNPPTPSSSSSSFSSISSAHWKLLPLSDISHQLIAYNPPRAAISPRILDQQNPIKASSLASSSSFSSISFPLPLLLHTQQLLRWYPRVGSIGFIRNLRYVLNGTWTGAGVSFNSSSLFNINIHIFFFS